jgi:transcriptional repressor NrdR
MRCPVCHKIENRVLESRAAEGGQSVRRRRECLKCEHRFTTYERIEFAPIVVLNAKGEREEFDRTKLLRDVMRACDRTAVPEPVMETLVTSVESELQQRANREITNQEVSELVLQHLRSISEVAYIRYASLNCDFEDVQGFMAALERLQQDSRATSSDVALSQSA